MCVCVCARDVHMRACVCTSSHVHATVHYRVCGTDCPTSVKALRKQVNTLAFLYYTLIPAIR